ncbi:unnamed protein product [Urochloa decumbens]|uniref:F-box domain-containing protein n=1 Tax=Urochloa decumbens TaxID=240449 RepID=A0ABC8Y6F3_9POAL
MESIENNVESSKQTTPSRAADDHGDDDRISGLCDDVLVRILGLAGGDAAELVRTGVLSRRWRGLWTRAPRLCFSPWPEFESAGDAERFVSFVNSVLEQRVQSGAGIDLLAILLSLDSDCLRGQRDQLVPPSMKAAEAWIRYAVQQPVTDFYFKLRLPYKMREDKEEDIIDLERKIQELMDDNDDDDEEEDQEEEELDEKENTDEDQSSEDEGEADDDQEKPVIDLDELPSSAKLETMHLRLSSTRVRLPSTAVFASLTDLALEFIELAAGSGHLLARILSPACCPRFQKLHMMYVKFKRSGTKGLELHAEELVVLSMENMDGMRLLELRTPNLLDLKIESCRELKALTVVSAPRLEKLAFSHNRWGVSHMFSESDINDSEILLLRRCRSARGLRVYLEIPSEIERRVDMIKDRIPQLPNITSLFVNIHVITERHSFGDGVASLLTRFSNLIYLGLQLDEVPGCTKRDEYYKEDTDGDLAFICDHRDNWKSNDISLAALREAEFRGLTGTGCELRFLQSVLASAADLERVTVGFSMDYNLKVSRIDEFLHTLLGDGTWTACEDGHDQSYEWTPIDD